MRKEIPFKKNLMTKRSVEQKKDMNCDEEQVEAAKNFLALPNSS